VIALLTCGPSLDDIVRDFGPVLALTGVAATLLINGAREERRRRLDNHARALEAVARYYEMPFLIKRRRHDEPSVERARLAGQFALVQAELASCEALIRADRDAGVRRAYATLVMSLRTCAGEQASLAWAASPITSDQEMGMGAIVEALKPIETPREECEKAMARSTTPIYKSGVRMSRYRNENIGKGKDG